MNGFQKSILNIILIILSLVLVHCNGDVFNSYIDERDKYKRINSDIIQPTVEITSSVSRSPINLSPFIVTIVFSEAVIGFEADDIKVDNGATDNFTSISPSQYTLEITPESDGPVTIDVDESVAHDLMGNGNKAGERYVIIYDGTRPTATIGSVESGPINSSFIIAVSFSEGVYGFELNDIVVDNGVVDNLISLSESQYTAEITPAGEGSVMVSVAAAVAHDLAGNGNEKAKDSSEGDDSESPFIIIYDSIPPTVAISTSQSDPTNSSFPVTIDFSEDVLGFEINDFVIGNGTASNLTVFSERQFTAMITPIVDGAVTIDLPAGKAQDDAGNLNIASNQFAITYNSTMPTVTISSPELNPTNTSPFTIMIEFTEDVSDFDISDIVVGNGISNNFNSLSQSQYSADITPSSDGVVTVDVASGAAHDIAGNPNAEALQFSINYDATSPIVDAGVDQTTNTASNQDASTDGTGSGIAGFTWSKESGLGNIIFSDANAEDTMINADADGDYVIRLTAMDAAGNSAYDDINFTWDTADPAVDAGVDQITNAPMMQNASTDGTGSGIASFAWTKENGPGNIVFGDPAMEDTIISADMDGDYTIRLTVMDAAGNSAYDDINFTWDATAPSIAAITSTTLNGAYGIGQNINITVTMNEIVTLTDGVMNILLDTSDMISITSSGFPTDTFTGIYSVGLGDESSDLDSIAIALDATAVLRDDAGNDANLSLSGKETIANGSDLIIDGVLPFVTESLTMDTDNNGKIDYYKLTFSETIIDSSFPGYIANNAGDNQSDWFILGHDNVILSHGTSAPESDIANDNVLYIKFDELEGSDIYDTGDKPDISSSSSPQLIDAVGNEIAQINTIDIAESDGASPIITSASGVTGTDVLSINFSEPVDADGSAGGICDETFETLDFLYDNNSGDDASFICGILDSNGCDSIISVILDTNLTNNDIYVDRISAAVDSIYDIEDNPVASYNQVELSGAISPYVLSVFATGDTKLRIIYSEPVNTTQALEVGNYTLSEENDPFGCADINLIDVTQKDADGAVYELTTDAPQCPEVTYKLEVDEDIMDQDDGVLIINPKFGTFLGNEQLKMVAGTCLTLKSMAVIFNKPVMSGFGADSGENIANYKFKGPNDLGDIDTAVRGGIGKENEVTISNINGEDQNGVSYLVIGANGIDGDGFDNGSNVITTTGISPTETLQSAPNDRVFWTGCGDSVDSFDEGPISCDPLGDGSDFGYVTSYEDKVYIGPNKNGNGAVRFEPDGTNPVNISFEFSQDTDGSDVHSNDSSVSGSAPPYVTIGHSGCIENSSDKTDGCGPDNEDGRGVFISTVMDSSEIMLFGGARTPERYGENPYFDYYYYTMDTDTNLNFSYVDLGDITGTVTAGLQSAVIMDSRTYIGLAKRNDTGTTNAPDFGRVSFNSDDATYCATPDNCDATNGDKGERIFINGMDFFGGNIDLMHANYGYYIGVDSMFIFNDHIYLANGGHNFTNRDGGIIRSNSSNPMPCTYIDNGYADCPSDWVEITPRERLEVTFDPNTELYMSNSDDKIYIYDINDNAIENPFRSGTQYWFAQDDLAGETITVPGNVVKIRLDDNGGIFATRAWGYAVTQVKAITSTGFEIDSSPGLESPHDYPKNYNTTLSYTFNYTSVLPVWNNGNSRFSVELPKIYDLIAGDRAFAQWAEYNGRLYVTRTTCTTSGTDTRDEDVHIIPGCNDGTDDNREAQLWKCDPTAGGDVYPENETCESDDWELIDGLSSIMDGITNLGDNENRTLSMVVANGSYLYIGYDNPIDGIQVYRTNVANPTTEDDFERVGTNGLGNPADMKNIFSAISIQQGADYFIYICAGKSGTPVAVYRQKNN